MNDANQYQDAELGDEPKYITVFIAYVSLLIYGPQHDTVADISAKLHARHRHKESGGAVFHGCMHFIFILFFFINIMFHF